MKNQLSVYVEIDMAATGKRIKELREKSGMTVEAVCKALGIENTACYYKWIRGDCLPSIEHLLELAALFGVSVDVILVYRTHIENKEEEQSAPLPYLYSMTFDWKAA